MAVTACNEVWDGRKADDSIEGLRAYTRCFRVETDNPEDGLVTVLDAPDLPVLGDIYLSDVESDDTCKVVKRTPNQDQDDPCTWMVLIEYSNEDANPLNEPRELTWSTTETTVPAVEDVEGYAIVNSAYEEFDPPVQKVEYDLTLTVVQNESVDDFDHVTENGFVGTVHGGPLTFYGFAANKARYARMTAAKQFKKNELGQLVPYWRVTREFQFKYNGEFKVRVLDQGYRELDEEDEPKPILGSNGQPVSKPVLLDGEGRRLEIDPAALPGEPGAPVFLEFEIYESTDLNQLGVGGEP